MTDTVNNSADGAAGDNAGVADGGNADAGAKGAATLLGGAATQQTADAGADDGSKAGGAADGGDGSDDNGGDDGGDKADDKPSGAPDKYEFSMPDGYTLDAEKASQFEAFARSNNLTNEAANEALKLAVDHVQSLQQAQLDGWREQVEAWGNEIRADKDLGGDKLDASAVIAQKALARFGSPELVDYLEESGLGNFPPLVRFCYQVGTRISEGGMIAGAGAGEGRRSTADVLYGGNKS